MALDARQAFKAAFISRCIEEGHTTPEQILGQVKQAQEKQGGVYDVGKDIWSGAKGVAGTASKFLIPLALAGPPILGGTAGYMAGRAGDIDDTDVAEAKNREILEELRRQTERLRQRQKAKAYRAQRDRTGRTYM